MGNGREKYSVVSGQYSNENDGPEEPPNEAEDEEEQLPIPVVNIKPVRFWDEFCICHISAFDLRRCVSWGVVWDLFYTSFVSFHEKAPQQGRVPAAGRRRTFRAWPIS